MSHWAIIASERLRTRCMIEAVVAELYGLSLAWISTEPS